MVTNLFQPNECSCLCTSSDNVSPQSYHCSLETKEWQGRRSDCRTFFPLTLLRLSEKHSELQPLISADVENE